MHDVLITLRASGHVRLEIVNILAGELAIQICLNQSLYVCTLNRHDYELPLGTMG